MDKNRGQKFGVHVPLVSYAMPATRLLSENRYTSSIPLCAAVQQRGSKKIGPRAVGENREANNINIFLYVSFAVVQDVQEFRGVHLCHCVYFVRIAVQLDYPQISFTAL